MASNPMKRKARNSFLLGVFITMIIAAVIIGLLLWQMYRQKLETEESENAQVKVYVLAKDVTKGTNVEINTLSFANVLKDAVPTSAITVSNYEKLVTEKSLFKIDLKAGTILSTDMIVEEEQETQDDTREQEFNMIILPTYLKKDDYVDIRLRLPSGQDYIVASKKKVIDSNELTIWMNLSEDEILTLSNAIVEAYQIEGALLYANRYVEPGIQERASITYVPKLSVAQLINSDPNVVQTAKEELAKRYNNGSLQSGRTDIIDPAISSVENGQEKVSSGTENSIETQRETRSDYLKELEALQTPTTMQ